MNLFIVPSWYPSESNPSYGIFVKEQIAMMAKARPEWKIGVSLWGQGDAEKLIWIKDHVKNLRKISDHRHDQDQISTVDGYTEFYQPALSWTKRIRKGNLDEIVRCNELNYQAYVLEFGKPDVIMVQACYPGILVASYLSRKYKVPVHLHIRLGGFMFEHLLSELGSLRKQLLDAISKSNIVTVTSNFHGEEVKRWVSNQISIYNPVDLDFFEVGKQSDNYAIAIGRLEKEKGFDLLLEAMKDIPDLKVKIVGSGSQEGFLKKITTNLKLDHRVSFCGEANRHQLRELIQRSNFLILPSRYETFGNVLLEAMACGKPIVATRCGGPEEIVIQEFGYLADVNAKDLAEKIKEMITNRDRFKSEIIREIAESSYAPDKWVDQLENIFKAI